jgi:hypothetical protein
MASEISPQERGLQILESLLNHLLASNKEQLWREMGPRLTTISLNPDVYATHSQNVIEGLRAEIGTREFPIDYTLRGISWRFLYSNGNYALNAIWEQWVVLEDARGPFWASELELGTLYTNSPNVVTEPWFKYYPLPLKIGSFKTVTLPPLETL